MSYPNSGQGQGGYAPGSSSNANGQAFNPALLNTSANTANFGNTTNTLSSPAPPMSLNPAQLQSLTDFHRQQQQQSQQAQAQAQQQQQRPTTSQSGIFLPEHVRQAMSTLTGTAKETFMKEYFKTDEGRRLLQLYNQDQQRQQAVLRAQQSSSSPMRTSSDLPPDSPPRQSAMSTSLGTGTGAGGGGSNRPHPGTPTPVQPKPLMPITKAIDPSSFARPTPSSQSQVANSNRIAPSNQASTPQPGPSSNQASTSQPPSLSQAERNQSSVAFWHSQNPPSYTPYRRPPSPEYRGSSGPSRRNEGMRGTMRSELARLMYASGDVENPDVDTIDYMEDLVVDWLADLCAPPPPVRAHDKAPLLTPRLDYNIIRHRLSRPSMRKYLDRFEYMEYKAVDMRSARRVAKGNFEPVDQKDLDGQLEKGFLDGEDAGGGGGAGEGDNRKKRKYKRQPQPPSVSQGQGQGQGQSGDGEEGQGKERKKPGPKKGWKRGERKNTAGAGGGGSSSAPSVRGTSIKPEE